MGQPWPFNLDKRYRRLSETGNPLVKLAAMVDFEIFRSRLMAALKRSHGSKGGPPPYDAQVPILQTLHTSRMTPSNSRSGTGCRSCAFCASGSRMRRLTPG